MSKELFNLGDDLSMRLRDFCEANWSASKVRVVREALDQFIIRQLSEEPEMRKRYEEARRKRAGKTDSKLHVLSGGLDDEGS